MTETLTSTKIVARGQGSTGLRIPGQAPVRTGAQPQPADEEYLRSLQRQIETDIAAGR